MMKKYEIREWSAKEIEIATDLGWSIKTRLVPGFCEWFHKAERFPSRLVYKYIDAGMGEIQGEYPDWMWTITFGEEERVPERVERFRGYSEEEFEKEYPRLSYSGRYIIPGYLRANLDSPELLSVLHSLPTEISKMRSEKKGEVICEDGVWTYRLEFEEIK